MHSESLESTQEAGVRYIPLASASLLRHICRRISEDQKGRNILNQTVTILTSQASANAFVSDAALGEQWKTWQTNTSGAVLTM